MNRISFLCLMIACTWNKDQVNELHAVGPTNAQADERSIVFVTDSFVISLSTCSTLFAKSVYRKSAQPMLRKNIFVLAINFKNKLQIRVSVHWSHESWRQCSCLSISSLIMFQVGNNLVFSFHVKNPIRSDKLMSFTGIFLAKCLFYLWFNQLF